MPLELGPISVEGRTEDFSIPGTSKEPAMPEYMKDILNWAIRATDQVRIWISDNLERLNLQHEKNISAIDTEIEQDIKASGGINTSMDVTTPSKIIKNEKNILVKLYLTKDSEADNRSQQSRSLWNGKDILISVPPTPASFVKASKTRVTINRNRLNNWAKSYENAKLSQVYAETSLRLKAKVQTLTHIENEKELNLNKAKEMVRLKQYPDAPQGVSLDQNLQESKRQKEYFSSGGGGFLFSWFYKKVRNHGEWDYKQRHSQYQNFGNFHYGAVGTAAGISEAVLLRAAGAAQSSAGTSEEDFNNWWSNSPYGDDFIDQVWIEAGIDYAKSKGY